MPVAALHRLLLLRLAQAHAALHAVLDAGAVADDQRGAGIGLRLPDGPEGLSRVRAHGHLSDVHVAVAHGHQAQVLFLGLLAARRELGDGRRGRGLGGLPAGVGVDLGVQHQDVDVLAGGENVVQPAVADVVGPAVAAEGPDGFLGQKFLVLPDEGGVLAGFILNGGQEIVADLPGGGGVIALFQIGVAGVRRHTALGQSMNMLRQLALHGVLAQQVAIGVLGVVLKEAHGPGGAEALLVRAVGGGGGGAAVGGGAAGGVGDVHAVAEELGHQLDVGRLAAARAGAGELEVGLRELGGFHVSGADGVLFDLHVLHSEGPVGGLLQLAVQGLHGQGAVLGEAHVDAAAATGAVVGRDLRPVGVGLESLGGNGLEALGLLRLLAGVQQNGPDGGVGADQGALVALDALRRVPDRNLHGGAPLFVLGGPGGPGAVLQTVLDHGGNRQAVALLAVHDLHHVLNEGGVPVLRRGVLGGLPAVRDLDLHQLVDAVVDGGVVHIYYFLALFFVVGLIDGIFHFRHRLVNGDNSGEGEKGGLENRVGAGAQP